MDAAAVLLIVLLVVAIAACGFVIWAAFGLVKAAQSTRLLAEHMDALMVPLLGKADVTIDVINVELLRIDEIVTRVEEVTDRVSSTSRTVQDVAHAPAEIVGELADRVRSAFRRRKHARATTTSTSAAPDAENAYTPTT